MIVGDTQTHEERSILIRRLSLKETVDRIVGREMEGSYSSREFSFKNQCILSSSSTLD